MRRGEPLRDAGVGVDAIVLAVPDAAIAEVAEAIEPRDGVCVVHLSGAAQLDVLSPHRRVASLHPLVSLANPQLGAARLAGAWFAVAGDHVAADIAAALHGRTFTVAESDRALYHATACIAANHLTGLLGQVQRLARSTGTPFEAFVDLARGSLDNVARLVDAQDALTGPVSRADWPTVAAHLAALPDDERAVYLALAHECARLAGRVWPNSGDNSYPDAS